jgi:CRP-like cAMP-binding protein
LDKGDYFGELSVMYDMPRSATVQCETSVTVLSLSREDIHSTVSEDKWEQMKILARTQVFSSVPFLSKLDTRLKVLLAGRLKTDLWQPGQVLFRENQIVNESSRRLYIIERGSCSASELGSHDPKQPNTPKRSSSVFLSTAKVHQPGSYFGMLECLYGCSHHITLTAHTEVTTLSISYQELQKLISAEVSAKEAQLVFETMKRCVRAHLIKSVHHSLAIAKSEVLEGVLDKSAITKDYQHWEVILRKGQPLTHICMLEQGTVLQYNGEAESFMANRMSATDCVENSRPGETFETRRMFGQANAAAPYTVIAISKCTIMHIDKESLEALQ